MATQNYSAADVSATFGGVPLQSESDDEFINITKPDNAFTFKRGINGFGTRSLNRSKHYVITVTLPQTSPTNAILSAIHKTDIETNGSGVVPFSIIDTNRTTVFAAAEAWIVKTPDWRAAAESDNVAWEIHSNAAEFFI